MKIIILLLLNIPSYLGLSQVSKQVFYHDHVECYYSNESPDSLLVYDSINGELIKSLKIGKGRERQQWFKIAIQESNDGWAKIENIMVAPGWNDSINHNLGTLKNKWIKIENLKIHIADMSLPDSLGVPFYKEPDSNSELVCKSGKFLILSLIETKGLWAKVSFNHNGLEYVAWIERKNQCAYPWTTCPYEN
jgi:hypothetical protein